MKIRLPALMGIDEALGPGTVRQLLVPGKEPEGRLVRYTFDKLVGLRFTPDDSSADIFLFKRSPPVASLASLGAVIVTALPADVPAVLDVAKGKWVHHPERPLDGLGVQSAAIADAARISWRGCFHFLDEDSRPGEICLRRPQLGALHAIHAHWSTSSGVATIVMPTGTGKTDTMLATLTSAGCERILVVVPTDALRVQIADKFLTLGVQKLPGNVILDGSAARPVVGMLTSRPGSAEDVDALFSRCNVVVTTSQLVGGCLDAVQARMADICTHLFIDEAHHTEAPTWRSFKARFSDKKVLQFTATPFREDDQLIDGKIIYVYPLRKAQAEGYFRPIRFSSVYEFDERQADHAIARQALTELDSDESGRHVAMARVANIARAKEVYAIYKELGRYEPVLLHSKVSSRDRAEATEKLYSSASRIVVCVDMLGEGFDMPELKIAAFHDVRKSLSVTLQLAGRFTRSREDLGNPVFIANIANIELRDELQRLYSQDPDWNALLADVSDSAIADEVAAHQYLAGFATELKDVPLGQLSPAASTVVYRTKCGNWTPSNFRRGWRGLSKTDQVLHSLNEREGTLVVVTATNRGVPWTDVSTVTERVWELFIAVWDRELQLLFIHGSSNSSEFRDLAKALCGDDVSIVVDPVVYRVLHGINRFVLKNVGLDEHFGRQIRYTGRMGADVGSRLSDPTKRSTRKAVLAGQGYEQGGRASIGAAKRGRVWSSQRFRVDTFAKWCRHIGAKIVDDSIDPEAVLKGTLIPKVVSARPDAVAISVDWPSALLDRPESSTSFSWLLGGQAYLTDVDIELVDSSPDSPLVLRIFSDEREGFVRLEFVGDGESSDFRFVQAGGEVPTIGRTTKVPLEDFLSENPPTIWFADGSCLEGNQYVELSAAQSPLSTDKLTACDWTGINLKKESQGLLRKSDTVQYRTIEMLKAAGGYDVIVDDDGAGEAADVVAIRITSPSQIHAEFYHCKYSLGVAPGSRIDDLYVVCGQAQRSVAWLHNKERRSDLFAHLIKRSDRRVAQGRGSRFEVGDKPALAKLRELSRRCEVTLSVVVVQPGVSKAAVSEGQLLLLGVTERYLFETYQVPFAVLCSE